MRSQREGLGPELVLCFSVHPVFSSWLWSWHSSSSGSKVSFFLILFNVSSRSTSHGVDWIVIVIMHSNLGMFSCRLVVLLATTVKNNKTNWRSEKEQLEAELTDLKNIRVLLKDNNTELCKQIDCLWRTFCGKWKYHHLYYHLIVLSSFVIGWQTSHITNKQNRLRNISDNAAKTFLYFSFHFFFLCIIINPK